MPRDGSCKRWEASSRRQHERLVKVQCIIEEEPRDGNRVPFLTRTLLDKGVHISDQRSSNLFRYLLALSFDVELAWCLRGVKGSYEVVHFSWVDCSSVIVELITYTIENPGFQ